MEQKNDKVYKLALTGLMAALSYVVFTFLQIKIQLPGGDATSIHLGNAVCVLGALLLGGFYGGLGGAIGMAIGDLLDPVYVVYVPKTLLLKLCIGLITGFIAHRLGKITESNDRGHVLFWTILAAAGGRRLSHLSAAGGPVSPLCSGHGLSRRGTAAGDGVSAG